MGSGNYSYATYTVESNTRGFTKKSRDQLFTNQTVATANTVSSFNKSARRFNTDVRQEMVNVGVRECRDSDEHPFSTPIIIALDVTGSMMDTPYEMIKDHLPKIMDAVIQLGVQDPQILFMAVGDHEYDQYPIQVGQFEADTAKILDTLQSLVIEGGGGGNRGESYLLAHIIAGYHTETDSFFKRGVKGFLFTIGDEPNLPRIPGGSLERVLGYQKGAVEISQEEAVQKAMEQYHVFHIHITNASYGTRSAESWKSLLGQNVLTCNSGEVDKVIAKAIRENYDEPIALNSAPSGVGTDVKSEPSTGNSEVNFY